MLNIKLLFSERILIIIFPIYALIHITCIGPELTTPNKFRKCSRRKFDGQIKKWRKLLHVWDENPELLHEIKHSIEDDDEDITDDFGGASLITNSDKQSYNLDDYDILDSDSDDKLVIDAIETLE